MTGITFEVRRKEGGIHLNRDSVGCVPRTIYPRVMVRETHPTTKLSRLKWVAMKSSAHDGLSLTEAVLYLTLVTVNYR